MNSGIRSIGLRIQQISPMTTRRTSPGTVHARRTMAEPATRAGTTAGPLAKMILQQDEEQDQDRQPQHPTTRRDDPIRTPYLPIAAMSYTDRSW